jgi:hypothetical protein
LDDWICQDGARFFRLGCCVFGKKNKNKKEMGGRKLFVITLLNLSMKYANQIFSLALVGRY